MLEALRVETARVRMSLVRYDENGKEQPVPVDPAGAKYLPPWNEFVYLRTSITNFSRKCPWHANLVWKLTCEFT